MTDSTDDVIARAQERQRARMDPAMHSREAPLGYVLKGVSTYDPKTRQWIKTARDGSNVESVIEVCERVLADKAANWPLAFPTPPPIYTVEDLLAVYPLGDPHLNMVAAASQVGRDFNIEVATRNLYKGIDYLVQAAPPARKALVCPMGDLLHADNQNSTTTKGTPQDTDRLYHDALEITIATMVRCIDRGLEKHAEVEVWIVPGNHDANSSIAIAHALLAHYRNEPRVTIRRPGPNVYWLEHGKCLLGATHGDKVKPAAIQDVMIADMPEAIGRTRFRYVYFGHVHHEVKKEYGGVVSESVRSLCRKDGYHASHGYRAGRSMFVDVWHKTEGKRSRAQFNIEAFEEAA